MLIIYSSGILNAKQRELAELQAMAQRRLKSTRANLADGMKAAREVRRDLEWTQKRVRYVRTCHFCPLLSQGYCLYLLWILSRTNGS